MNFYRWLASVLIVIAIFLLVVFGMMLAAALGAGPMTPEVRRALLVLLLVILLLLLVILFLLCLARAKERLGQMKKLYREAHGGDRDLRARAEAELARWLEKNERLRGLCDVLVRRKFPRPCLSLPIEVTRRPDPCIYSQFYLMAAGLPVTWDNPNVEILLGGVPQDTYNLLPSTTYQVRVGLENASPFFDALNTQVQVNELTFGIGGQIDSSAQKALFTKNIPAATSFPGVFETFPWTTPSTAGHFCLQVLITHPQDAVPANNEGWNNSVIQSVSAGQAFRLAIPVWNALRVDEKRRDERADRFARIALTVDSYELPVAQLPIEDDPEVLFVPRPALWEATLSATDLTIPPGTRTPANVDLEIRVPAGAAPNTRAVFNVSATAGGRPLGGVTISLEVR